MKISLARSALVVVTLLAVAPALAGCSLNPIEAIVEQATGGDVAISGAEVPEGFPAEVPLADGEIMFGGGMKGNDGQVWTVSMKITDPNAFDSIKTQLTDAGFAANDVVMGTTEAGSIGTFQNDSYSVSVIVSTSDSETTVNYTVTDITP